MTPEATATLNLCAVLTRSIAASIVGDTNVKGALSDGGKDCTYSNPPSVNQVSVEINPFAQFETAAQLKSFAAGMAYLAAASKAVFPIAKVGTRAYGWSFDTQKVGVMKIANAGGVVFLQSGDQVTVMATSATVTGGNLLTRCKTVARLLAGKL